MTRTQKQSDRSAEKSEAAEKQNGRGAASLPPVLGLGDQTPVR